MPKVQAGFKRSGMTGDLILAGDMTTVADAGEEAARSCPACGTSASRRAARFCRTCGRGFAVDDGYAPVDFLRASYHAQHSSPASRVVHLRRAADRASRARIVSPRAASSLIPQQNRVAAFALASIVYALVPLLGIIFCPAAILFGGWAATATKPHTHTLRGAETDGRRAARFSFLAGWLLLCLQLL